MTYIRSFIGTAVMMMTVVLQTSCGLSKDVQNTDDAYFSARRHLLTAVWDKPFSCQEVRTNHAPLGPFLGNGDVGCLAATAYNSQTMLLSKVDFVTDGWSDWAGDGAAALPVGGVRVTIDAPEASGFDYRMDLLANRLEMQTATKVPVRMCSWLAAIENLLVTELTVQDPEADVDVTVETFAGGTTGFYGASAQLGRNRVGQVTRTTKSTPDVEWVSRAGISTRIIGTEAQLKVVSDSSVCHTFHISGDHKVYVVSCVSGGGMSGQAGLTEACARLSGLTPRRISEAQTEKDRWWQDMWRRSYVETGDSLLDRYYLSSIYLMASAYRAQAPSCGGMYGVWNMDDRMMYHGDIHLNYNSQAGFYSAFSANRPELALPFFDFVERVMPDGARRAREEMGQMHPSLAGRSCRGLLFPVSASGIGRFYGGYWQQTMNAPFCIPLFSWYYDYTGDMEFLRDRAYPYIRACGDFYEDYLVREAWNGSYRYSIRTGGHENSWDLNPPSDVAFVDLTFRLLLRYSELLNADADRRALWRDIQAHLPQYKVIQPTREPNQGLPVYAKNEDGWDAPAHMIQLHALYPCEVMDLDSDPESLQVARNTIYYYGVSQNGFTGTMNELGLSAFVMGARAGFDPDILLAKLGELVATSGRNFLITDGHHCLEKTAGVEMIHSMMLQTVNGVIRLFPNWPASRRASFTRLRTKGGFLVTAAYDGGEVVGDGTCRLTAAVGGICRLKNPWDGSRVCVTDRSGRRVPVTEDGDVITFQTERGETYSISRTVQYGNNATD